MCLRMTITKQSIEILSIYWFSNRQKQFAAWNCLNWFYYCSKKGVSFPYNRYIVSTAHSLPPSWHSPPLPILLFSKLFAWLFNHNLLSNCQLRNEKNLEKNCRKVCCSPFLQKNTFQHVLWLQTWNSIRGYEILKCQNRKTFGLLQHTGIFWHLLFINGKLTIIFTVNAS